VLPLHELVEAPDEAAEVQIAKLLLARNAPVDSPDSQGNTALMLAVSSSKLQLAAALLKTGASTAARRSSGRTALHCAAQAGSAAAVQLLVKHYGADAAAAAAAAGCFDGKGRRFLPLHYACKAGHVQVSLYLFNAPLTTDTALAIASSHHHWRPVGLFCCSCKSCTIAEPVMTLQTLPEHCRH
jgi:ankyrin repeat protein